MPVECFIVRMPLTVITNSTIFFVSYNLAYDATMLVFAKPFQPSAM